MGSDLTFVKFVVDQLDEAGDITYKHMFGEYGIFCNGKFTALICENKFFIKPTESGRAFIKDVKEAPPYPGAKNYFLIEDKIEDGEWMSSLMRTTWEELPEKKLGKRKAKK